MAKRVWDRRLPAGSLYMAQGRLEARGPMLACVGGAPGFGEGFEHEE
jgi:hypothetical protein